MHNDHIKVILFFEIISNRGVLIFVDFVVHVKRKNENPTKYNFPIDSCLLFLKPRIQEPKDHCIV
jgi:hypothetical protein